MDELRALIDVAYYLLLHAMVLLGLAAIIAMTAAPFLLVGWLALRTNLNRNVVAAGFALAGVVILLYSQKFIDGGYVPEPLELFLKSVQFITSITVVPTVLIQHIFGFEGNRAFLVITSFISLFLAIRLMLWIIKPER